jgi:hypothetical protein
MISLTIDEEIIPCFLLESKKIVSISLFITEFVSAICFSYSKSKEDLSPLNINSAFSFSAKFIVSPLYFFTKMLS